MKSLIIQACSSMFRVLWRKGGIVRFQRLVLRSFTKRKRYSAQVASQGFDKICLSKSSRLTSFTPIRYRSPLQNALKVGPIMPGRRFSYGPGGASNSI